MSYLFPEVPVIHIHPRVQKQWRDVDRIIYGYAPGRPVLWVAVFVCVAVGFAVLR